MFLNAELSPTCLQCPSNHSKIRRKVIPISRLTESEKIEVIIIDKRIFMILFNLAKNNESLARIMLNITKLSSKIFAIIYLIFIISLVFMKDNRFLPLLLGPALTLLTVNIIRFIYYRPRPFLTLPIESLIEHRDDSSMPSKHTASAFAIAIAISYINIVIGFLLLIFAAFTAISRIMIGLHYPLDILVATILGLNLSALVFYIIA
ncbi:phosphatase PAP2 family protein [Natronospora cellulosivora (SeqCode)]